MMAWTHIKFVTTASADGIRDPGPISEFVDDQWATDIRSPFGDDYSAECSTSSSTVSLDNPSSTLDAFGELKSDPTVQGLLGGNVEAVCVIDDRTYSDNKLGMAHRYGAGTVLGGCYINGDGGNSAALHEIGHLYGGHHADDLWGEDGTFQDGATTLSSTVMMNPGTVWGCGEELADLYRDSYFSACTTSTIREYMESGNI